MALFKELDPQLHLKLIEGYEDELTPEANKLEAFYQANRKCKRCGDSMQKQFNPATAWSGESLVAKALLTCSNCGFTLEPFTGIIVDTGSAAKIPEPMVPEYKTRIS